MDLFSLLMEVLKTSQSLEKLFEGDQVSYLGYDSWYNILWHDGILELRESLFDDLNHSVDAATIHKLKHEIHYALLVVGPVEFYLS